MGRSLRAMNVKSKKKDLTGTLSAASMFPRVLYVTVVFIKRPMTMCLYPICNDRPTESRTLYKVLEYREGKLYAPFQSTYEYRPGVNNPREPMSDALISIIHEEGVFSIGVGVLHAYLIRLRARISALDMYDPNRLCIVEVTGSPEHWVADGDWNDTCYTSLYLSKDEYERAIKQFADPQRTDSEVGTDVQQAEASGSPQGS